MHDLTCRESKVKYEESRAKDVVERKKLKNIENRIERTRQAASIVHQMKSTGVVHLKYTDPECLMFLWDVLDTGRTHTLVKTGFDHGAGNLLEEKLAYDKF